jgi:hypothetical protein
MAVAAMAFFATPALGKRGYIYDVTSAKGFERLTFSGDPAADCASFGTCDYAGVTTYTISGKPKGTIALTRKRSGEVKGSARYTTNGTTVSDVTPVGSRPNCSDSVDHTRDGWSIASSGASFRNLLVTYHEGLKTDYLATNCAGPTEKDVKAAGVLPTGRFSAKDFFRGEKPSFSISGGTPFQTGGWNASIEWDLKFKARERNCSPHCKLPR